MCSNEGGPISAARPRLWLAAALWLLACSSSVGAETRCVETAGSAAVIGNDVASARTEAAARAKWSAIEQAVGVEVRSQTLVQNSMLLDDLVSQKAKGTISSFKILSEQQEGGLYNMTLNSCVEPAKAAETLASLALNQSVAVFVPARKPHEVLESRTSAVNAGVRSSQSTVKSSDEQDETNIFSETLIGKLVDQGFTVTDIAPTQAADAEAVEKAMKSGNFLTVRSLIGKFLSNLLLIGKVDYTVSQRKGDDIGYDLEMPFNKVTVRLSYRLLSREPESGKMLILGAGTSEAVGTAPSVEDAAAKGLETLSDKVIPGLLDKFAKHVKGSTRKVSIKVEGLDQVATAIDLRQLLAGVTWVSDVEAVGLDEFLISYPENSIYLANSLSRHPKLKVVEYSPYQIRLSYRK